MIDRPLQEFAIQSPLETVSWQSIRENLRTPSLGLFFFLVGFHGIFFIPLVFPRVDEQTGKSLLLLALSWILITLGALLESFLTRMHLFGRHPVWMWLALLSLGTMFLLGFHNNASVPKMAMLSLPFWWLLFIPAIAMRAENWPWLWLSFIANAVVGAPYAIYAAFIQGVTTRGTTLNYSGYEFLGLTVYMAPFLFLMLPILRGRKLQAFVLIVLGVELLNALFIANRYTWLLLPAQILMLTYVYFRMHGGHRFIQQTFSTVLVAIVFIPILLAIMDSSVVDRLAPTFSESYQGLQKRMLEKGSLGDTIRENIRWIEARDSMATMEGSDWLIGKGFGASWNSIDFLSGMDRFMIHNTWLNSLFWGGYLLFIVVNIPLFIAISVFFRSANPAGMCCASYMLLIYAKFPAYLITMPTQQWILFCLAFGVCICNNPVTSRQSKLPYHRPARL